METSKIAELTAEINKVAELAGGSPREILTIQIDYITPGSTGVHVTEQFLSRMVEELDRAVSIFVRPTTTYPIEISFADNGIRYFCLAKDSSKFKGHYAEDASLAKKRDKFLKLAKELASAESVK